jgi:hypothetical protein
MDIGKTLCGFYNTHRPFFQSMARKEGAFFKEQLRVQSSVLGEFEELPQIYKHLFTCFAYRMIPIPLTKVLNFLLPLHPSSLPTAQFCTLVTLRI